MRLAFVDDDYGEIKKLTTMIDKELQELFIRVVLSNFSALVKHSFLYGNQVCMT